VDAGQRRDATNPSRASAIVDDLARELHTVSKALAGVADRMDHDGQGDDLLLDEAAGLVVQVACEGLVETAIDLRARVPAAAALMDECRERIRARAERAAEASNTSAPPPVGAREREGESRSAGHLDQADLLWRQHVLRVRLEDLQLRIARDGDPGEEAIAERRRVHHELLRACWEHLSEKFPTSLTPEVACIKKELLHGVDPWSGLARDYRKAGWVCGFFAEHIANRCDLSVADAAREWRISRSTIWRACKAGHIVNNGKAHKGLRISRKSFATWRREHDSLKARRNAQRAAAVSMRNRYKCMTCRTTFSTEPRECPRCGKEGIVITLRPSRGPLDATTRNNTRG
jgi:DNA-directed RNA polymerase subunit RPC12/RpoP